MNDKQAEYLAEFCFSQIRWIGYTFKGENFALTFTMYSWETLCVQETGDKLWVSDNSQT